MRVAIKVVDKVTISVIAWLIIMLAVSAAVELSFDKRLPALISLITLTLVVPVLFVIWRR